MFFLGNGSGDEENKALTILKGPIEAPLQFFCQIISLVNWESLPLLL